MIVMGIFSISISFPSIHYELSTFLMFVTVVVLASLFFVSHPVTRNCVDTSSVLYVYQLRG